jgi:hypothetical protein
MLNGFHLLLVLCILINFQLLVLLKVQLNVTFPSLCRKHLKTLCLLLLEVDICSFASGDFNVHAKVNAKIITIKS